MILISRFLHKTSEFGSHSWFSGILRCRLRSTCRESCVVGYVLHVPQDYIGLEVTSWYSTISHSTVWVGDKVCIFVCVREKGGEREGKRQYKIHIHSLSTKRQNQTKRPAITVVNQALFITKSGCSFWSGCSDLFSATLFSVFLLAQNAFWGFVDLDMENSEFIWRYKSGTCSCVVLVCWIERHSKECSRRLKGGLGVVSCGRGWGVKKHGSWFAQYWITGST